MAARFSLGMVVILVGVVALQSIAATFLTAGVRLVLCMGWTALVGMGMVFMPGRRSKRALQHFVHERAARPARTGRGR